jgi:hypothetical protein
MVRGVCAKVDCGRPAVARGLCSSQHSRWDAGAADSELRPPTEGLSVRVVAALGIGVRSLYNRIGGRRFLPDGRTGGRLWWWPATVERYGAEHRPAGTVSAEKVADLLGCPLRQVYRLAKFPPVGRFGNRPRVDAHRRSRVPGSARSGRCSAVQRGRTHAWCDPRSSAGFGGVDVATLMAWSSSSDDSATSPSRPPSTATRTCPPPSRPRPPTR